MTLKTTWVDIRLHREDVPVAVRVLGAARRGCIMHIDTNPHGPHGGLEWELSINVGGQITFDRILRTSGIEPIAIRTRT